MIDGKLTNSIFAIFRSSILARSAIVAMTKLKAHPPNITAGTKIIANITDVLTRCRKKIPLFYVDFIQSLYTTETAVSTLVF